MWLAWLAGIAVGVGLLMLILSVTELFQGKET